MNSSHIYGRISFIIIVKILFLYQSLPYFFFHLLARKPKFWKKNSVYSYKLFHNFHLSKSSFTCIGLRASGLARRLYTLFISYQRELYWCNQCWNRPSMKYKWKKCQIHKDFVHKWINTNNIHIEHQMFVCLPYVWELLVFTCSN